MRRVKAYFSAGTPLLSMPRHRASPIPTLYPRTLGQSQKNLKAEIKRH